MIALFLVAIIPGPFERDHFTYPFAGVVYSAGIVTIEIGILFLIIRPHNFSYSYGRILISLLVTVIFFFLFPTSKGLSDRPSYVRLHLYIDVFLILFLSLLFFWSAIGSIRNALRKAPEGDK